MKRLEIGSSLGIPELLAVSSLLTVAARAQSYGRHEKSEEFPDDSLDERFRALDPLTPVNKEIKRCLPSEDEVSDDASPGLAKVRRSMKIVGGRVHTQLNSILNSSRTYLQDAVITMRDGRYCLGVRLFEYGCAVGASWSVSDQAKPHLQHMASVTGPSVFLSMLNRSEVITIEQVQSRAGLRVVSEVGTRLPLHCTSQGKVVLSAMADHEAKRVLPRRTLEPYTPKTLVTWEELFRVMQAARENGYAVEVGVYRSGRCSPSAPVRDSSGAVRYAVGVVGMFDCVRSPAFQRDIDLTCAAAQISTALGYRA